VSALGILALCVAVVVKGRMSVHWKRRKTRKTCFTYKAKWVKNYYDKNLYYIMYAASGIKLKMRKTHSFYRAQLSLLLKKVVCVSYDLLPRQRGIAVDKGRK